MGKEIDFTTLSALDEAICQICGEMNGRNTDRVIALAKVLRDLVVARAVLTDTLKNI